MGRTAVRVAKPNRRADHVGQFRTAYEKNKKKIFATQTVCGICGKPVDFSLKAPDPMSPTVDHIIPISRGGHPSDLNNLQLSHWICNRMKSNKLMNQPFANTTAQKTVSNRDLPQTVDWRTF